METLLQIEFLFCGIHEGRVQVTVNRVGSVKIHTAHGGGVGSAPNATARVRNGVQHPLLPESCITTPWKLEAALPPMPT